MNPSDVAQKYSSKYTSTLSNKTNKYEKADSCEAVNMANELNLAKIMI